MSDRIDAFDVLFSVMPSSITGLRDRGVIIDSCNGTQEEEGGSIRKKSHPFDSNPLKCKTKRETTQ